MEDIKQLMQLRLVLMVLMFVTPFLYWFGVINTGPLEWARWAMAPFFEPDSVGSQPSIIRVFSAIVGGMLWAGLIAPFVQIVSRRIGILEAGSLEAYEQAESEAWEKANTPESLGELVSIQVLKGGFLSSDESIVETTQGFFRVSGKVGGVMKGAPVSQLHGRLTVGEPNVKGRSFTLLD
ncbi:hypothetical protein DENIT_70038 [Pseudomonas veronii]|uniref:hypothetical protein n=1 Tax=Pseudomonas veronii TaxID=76761 RepID=UPI00175433F1|nr:hypothetical protein [Pseudomonas veronii]CAD0266061.1 hypothetical protein DENIT_70038 [Pseudomonas veronii]